MFNLGMPELLLVLVIALVVFGPGKLPDVGKALGKGLGEFRRATSAESATTNPSVVEVETGGERQRDKAVAKTGGDSIA